MMRKRFGLRTFFILLTLFCVALGTMGVRMYRNYRESAAVAEIRSLGGILQEIDGKTNRVHLQGKTFDDEMLLRLVPHLQQLPSLVELDLVQCPITDVGLQKVGELVQLRVLYIFEVAATADGVADLQQRLPKLQIKNEMPDPIASGLVATNIYRHAITTLALGEGGATFVTGSGDGMLRWWDSVDLEAVQHDAAHSEWLFATAFSPDRRLLATGGGDNMIALWDVRTRKQIGKLQAHSEDVHALAFSSDGKTVFSTGDDMSVRRTSLTQFTEKTTSSDRSEAQDRSDAPGRSYAPAGSYAPGSSYVMGYHDDTVPCIALSPDGQLVASGSRDDSIQLWNASDGRPVRKLTGHTGDVMSIAFAPTSDGSIEGSVLVSGSYDGSIRRWNTSSGEIMGVMQGHRGRVYSVDVSSDGSTVASAGEDGVIVWNVATLLPKYHLQNLENASCVRFSGRQQIVVTDAMGIIRVIDLATGSMVRRADTSRATLAVR